MRKIINSFSFLEKLLFGGLLLVSIISGFLLIIKMDNKFSVEIPKNGGIIHEGLIGTPRFLNPLIHDEESSFNRGVSYVDREISALVYSGLLRKKSDGSFIPDLAEKYEISEDGLEYKFYLKENLYFHDKTPLTTDDIIFTVLKSKDGESSAKVKSLWQDVAIEKVNDKEIVFRLNKPRSDFLESTTIGILPRHLWENVTGGGFRLSKYNTEPIGSGPYKISKIKKDSKNIPISYELKAFKEFALGKPKIKEINFHFAKNESELIEMYNNGEINAVGGVSPESINKINLENTQIEELPLPRIFGVFFNQNEAPILANKKVREALDTAIPKEEIIRDVFYGFANVIEDPITEKLDLSNSTTSINETSAESKIDAAALILRGAGWKKNDNGIFELEDGDEKKILSLSIVTSNAPELVAVAEKVVSAWEKLGVETELKIFDIEELTQNVIKPRNFEVFLFGFIVDNYSDLYSFWHSSERLDPGQNIIGYANISVDKIVTDLLDETNVEEIKNSIHEFKKNIKEDKPASFIYSPNYIYLIPNKIKGFSAGNINTSDDKFMNVYEWYIENEKVWKIFN